jgi:hypothetical protein
MLGDVTRNMQNIADEQPDLARAVDSFMTACMEMMNAAGLVKERLGKGTQVSGGQMSIHAQVLNALVDQCGGVAQQAYTAMASGAVSAAASYTIERQRLQGATIRAIKTKD